jgi:hypothetical protein
MPYAPITHDQHQELAAYIIAYIDEELARNSDADIDATMIASAIEAYAGGAR